MTHDALGKQDGFYRVNLENGRSWKLLESGSCYTCVNIQRHFTVAKDGQRLAFFSEDAQHDTDVWMSAPDFGSPRRLTHLNPQFDEYQMASARLVSWLSEDGEQLQGALLLPSDFRERKRYPLVVWVYGGASLSDRLNRFGLAYGSVFNLQLLATRGYAVLVPDAPQHLATPMLDLAKTVLPGINKVIEMGIADPDRLGVMGHSFGGYSTLALITQTKRFKAAIEADGFGDFIGAYGQMGKDGTAYLTTVIEQGSGLMGGTPWEFRSRYIENSPVFYLDRVETPLLILHGSLDTAVASFLGDEVFVGLRRLGKEVEYAKYEGEGHSPLSWSYSNQVDVCNRMIAWLNAHLKNQQEH
jgi:dipeptidyl aminopeptidase/acylaminoacyl peptidase